MDMNRITQCHDSNDLSLEEVIERMLDLDAQVEAAASAAASSIAAPANSADDEGDIDMGVIDPDTQNESQSSVQARFHPSWQPVIPPSPAVTEDS